MIHLHERLNKEKLPAKLILQVHDELVLTCATAKVEKVCEVVKESMQQAMQLAVPLKVEIGFGKNWLEAH
jgi:DNA polymerase-1